MTEADDARRAAMAAGCADLLDGEASQHARGTVLPRRDGFLLVSPAFDPDGNGALSLRAVYLDADEDPMIRRPTVVADVPDSGLLSLRDPDGFAAFARWASTRISPRTLAELLVQQQGPHGATVLAEPADETGSDGEPLHIFAAHELPEGGWSAGPFSSLTHQRDDHERLIVTVGDWHARVSPTEAVWGLDRRKLPAR
jgi:hypothetical protein